jgi:hypothetical protein
VRERGDERQKVERLSLNVPIESCGRMQSGERAGREDQRWESNQKGGSTVWESREGELKG